jgi:hypothetical protein
VEELFVKSWQAADSASYQAFSPARSGHLSEPHLEVLLVVLAERPVASHVRQACIRVLTLADLEDVDNHSVSTKAMRKTSEDRTVIAKRHRPN